MLRCTGSLLSRCLGSLLSIGRGEGEYTEHCILRSWPKKECCQPVGDAGSAEPDVMPSFLIESGRELQKKDPNLLLADKIVNQSAFPPNQNPRRAVRGVPVEEGLALRSESDQGWRGVVGDSSNEMILFGSQSSDPIPVGREGGEPTFPVADEK